MDESKEGMVAEQQPAIEQQLHDDEVERRKQYNEENVMSVTRLDFETQEMYKRRRAYMNKRMKARLRGSLFFVSNVTVPMYEEAENGDKKLVKHEKYTDTFRYKDHPELKRKTFKEQKDNEEVGNKDDEERTV